VSVWELPELMSRMGMTEQSKVNSGLEEVIQESHRRANGKGKSMREPRGPRQRPLVAESITLASVMANLGAETVLTSRNSRPPNRSGANATVELRKVWGKDECARHWTKD
jgi:hypothetical protein